MDYQEILSRIEQVRSVLGDCSIIKLPQIVVIGDQSSGKSSLLSSISGIPFPEASGMTTKCPIVVNTKYSDIDDNIYTINSNEEEKNEVINEEECSAKILEYQQNLVSTSKVSVTPITISVEGRNFNDLVLVDLPGIISNGDGKEEILDMIEKYISPKESLILVVTPAYQDDETAYALELAKIHDPDEERTLRILTKYDIFDSPDKNNQANDLVNDVSELSPHAVICRNNGTSYNKYFEESTLFECNLPTNRCGIETLKERLSVLLCQLITTNLPGLREQIIDCTNKNKKLLKEIGEEEPNSTTIIISLKNNLLSQISNINELLTPLLIEFQNNIHTTRDILSMELVEEYYEYDTFNPPFFQGTSTFNNLLNYIVELWRPIIETLHSDINELLDNLIDNNKFASYSTDLKRTIISLWNNFKNDIMMQLIEQMNYELEKELKFKTMNHYLTSKFEENLVLPDTVVNSYFDSLDETMFVREDTIRTYNNTHQTIHKILNINKIKENLKTLLISKVEQHIEEFYRLDIMEQHKIRVLAAIKANWSVSQKNLIDNIHYSVYSIIVEQINEWCANINNNESIINNARENKELRRNRIKYRNELDMMNECHNILNF